MNGRAIGFRRAVQQALQDAELQAALYAATSAKQAVHKQGIGQLHDADALRRLAAAIKGHTLDHLDDYLAQFVEHAQQAGAEVHFAPSAAEARRFAAELAHRYESKLCVKAKSMTTEEVELTGALEAVGVEVVETDLGEFIVQIDHDRPSHIVTPIIHKNRKVIAEAFVRELGIDYTEDPKELTQHARRHLRAIFRRCDLGVTGVNFAIAESGSICLCTNEGNGRLTVTRPRVQIALMGIEKVIPRVADLSVFLKLLARSGTGQPLTCYTTMLTGPRRPDDPDGPEHLHIIILDNGRREILAGPCRDVLRCIRCGACLNACPVYGKIGGHAYDSVYPGPIGSALTPLLRQRVQDAELPQASSLCGLCREVCPVQIDIPGLLVRHRVEQVRRKEVSSLHRWAFRLARWGLRKAWRYRWAQAMARFALGADEESDWTDQAPLGMRPLTLYRDLRRPAPRSFRQLWERGLKDE